MTGTEDLEAETDKSDVSAVKELFQSYISNGGSVLGIPYIASDAGDSFLNEVYLLIGPDGHIIPTSEWQSNNKGKCRKGSLRYMRVADKRLNMDIHQLEDGYLVGAQYIDIETGVIEEQREGQSSSLVDAITTALGKIKRPIKKPTGPCGDKIDSISLKFEAKTHLEQIREAGFTDSTDERVEATVNLTYNKQDSMYVGSGDLKWTYYNLSWADCQLPEPARLRVHKFVYGDTTEVKGEKELHIQFHDWVWMTCKSGGSSFEIWPDFSFSWWLLHLNEIHRKADTDNLTATVEYIYAIHDWKLVQNNDNVIIKKTYDHSNTVDDGSIYVEGESSIKIMHNDN